MEFIAPEWNLKQGYRYSGDWAVRFAVLNWKNPRYFYKNGSQVLRQQHFHLKNLGHLERNPVIPEKDNRISFGFIAQIIPPQREREALYRSSALAGPLKWKITANHQHHLRLEGRVRDETQIDIWNTHREDTIDLKTTNLYQWGEFYSSKEEILCHPWHQWEERPSDRFSQTADRGTQLQTRERSPRVAGLNRKDSLQGTSLREGEGRTRTFSIYVDEQSVAVGGHSKNGENFEPIQGRSDEQRQYDHCDEVEIGEIWEEVYRNG